MKRITVLFLLGGLLQTTFAEAQTDQSCLWGDVLSLKDEALNNEALVSKGYVNNDWISGYTLAIHAWSQVPLKQRVAFEPREERRYFIELAMIQGKKLGLQVKNGTVRWDYLESESRSRGCFAPLETADLQLALERTRAQSDEQFLARLEQSATSETVTSSSMPDLVTNEVPRLVPVTEVASTVSKPASTMVVMNGDDVLLIEREDTCPASLPLAEWRACAIQARASQDRQVLVSRLE